MFLSLQSRRRVRLKREHRIRKMTFSVRLGCGFSENVVGYLSYSEMERTEQISGSGSSRRLNNLNLFTAKRGRGRGRSRSDSVPH